MKFSDATITTAIWQEIPDTEDPMQAGVCYCAGYDVYQDLLGKITWIEYLFLLFRRELPCSRQRALLEGLAVALANPGPRDLSVRAAMNGGAGGSTAASCLMAALAVAAGYHGGARDVYHVMVAFEHWGDNLEHWRTFLTAPRDDPPDSWPEVKTAPGFMATTTVCPAPIKHTLDYLAATFGEGKLAWLRRHRTTLESITGLALAQSAVAAAALADLGFSPDAGEALFLLLRLPGASAHALEQSELGWRAMPFHATGIQLSNDPGLQPRSRRKS